MFNFLRNLGRSEEEQQQDAMSAYLDNALAPAERERFEQQLALDSALREKLAEMQFWRQQMRALPPRRVPRNFTLDPALYGRPQRQPLAGAYPMLRTATALTAFLFVIALASTVYLGGLAPQTTPQAETMVMVESAMEAAPATEAPKLEMDTAVETEPEGFLAEEQEAVEEAAAADEAGAAAAEAVDMAAPMTGASDEAPPGLLSIQGTGQPPPRADAVAGEPAPLSTAETVVEEVPAIETAVETERLAATPAAAAAAATTEMPVAAEESAPPTSLLPGGSAPFLLGLGLLFVVLLVLTLLARPRR